MKATDPYENLTAQARDVFRQVVEFYLETGTPVGSRALSPFIGKSPAWIRNFMADLEDMELLAAPHTSAGRIPTQKGLRFFIDGIMETGTLNEHDQRVLEHEYHQQTTPNDMFAEASRVLSTMTQSAGLVVTGKADKAIRNIQFMQVSPVQAMVIIVAEDNSLENRMMTLPPGITTDILTQASNFLSSRLAGKTMKEMTTLLKEDISVGRGELRTLLEQVEEQGIAVPGDGMLIVRGASNLLSQEASQLDHIRRLMEQLESKETASQLLEQAVNADGVKIFLGSEMPVFESSGHSLILTPYRNGAGTFVGAVGVIGPTRLNYAKIVPSVNFVAEMIGRNIRKLSEP